MYLVLSHIYIYVRPKVYLISILSPTLSDYTNTAN